jgi:hypothetical protein
LHAQPPDRLSHVTSRESIRAGGVQKLSLLNPFVEFDISNKPLANQAGRRIIRQCVVNPDPFLKLKLTGLCKLLKKLPALLAA